MLSDNADEFPTDEFPLFPDDEDFSASEADDAPAKNDMPRFIDDEVEKSDIAAALPAFDEVEAVTTALSPVSASPDDLNTFPTIPAADAETSIPLAEEAEEVQTAEFDVDYQKESEAPPVYQGPISPHKKPPEPEYQSAFVNPALARIAAVRSREILPESSEFWLGLRTIIIIIGAAMIVSFIFNYWTPQSFLSDKFVQDMQVAYSTQGPPTPLPTPLPTYQSMKTIGIIAGHSGPPLDPTFDIDPGAICDDDGDGLPELTELSINTAVAQRVARSLVEAGYNVELLEEYDPRLTNYRADTLVSIHSNTCENLGFGATGFNILNNTNRAVMRDRDQRLVDCLVDSYSASTGLERHFGISDDLVGYHVFNKVSVDTPTVIVELGFMFSDRQTLTQRPDAMADGIVQGILCFMELQNNGAILPPTTPESP